MTKEMAALCAGLLTSAEESGNPEEAVAVDGLLQCYDEESGGPYWLTVPRFVERHIRRQPEGGTETRQASVAWDEAMADLSRGQFDECPQSAQDALRFAAWMSTGVVH